MSQSLAGQLADFDLAQLVVMLEAGQSSGALTLRGSSGEGRLELKGGQMVYAEAASWRGELAVFHILSWDDGEFSFTRGAATSEQNLYRSNQGLCLEAMRVIDESRSDKFKFARCDGAPTAPIPAAAGRVLSSMTEAVEAGSVAKALGLTKIEAYYHLEELERLGAVQRVSLSAENVSVAEETDRKQDRVRVLLVDDSLFMRKVLERTYASAPDLLVVGTASNGEEALEMLRKLKPDVVSLDLYMPVMDGVTTLKRIMLSQPTPTVIVTSAEPDALELTFEAILRFGAIDFITKPSQARGSVGEQAEQIVDRLRKAARVNLRGVRMFQPPAKVRRQAQRGRCRSIVVALGGTGSCLSYMQLLTSLPVDLPFALIGLLRFPDNFLRAFASYLRKHATFDVEMASEGALLESGVCYLASAYCPPRLEPADGGVVLRVGGTGCDEGAAGQPPCSDGIPCAKVEQPFLDAAGLFGENATGLLLSGEGSGGLRSLAAIRSAGGITLAQVPDSCVDAEQSVQAIERDLVDRAVLLPNISNELSHLLKVRTRQSPAESGHVA